ncbi:uncharacterized protein [Typha latifolia]|uniref:uncharacterized protein isoform X2 n=1 Tax=Typha latifolia TaxID=4733 RepID=UPI003C2D51D5
MAAILTASPPLSSSSRHPNTISTIRSSSLFPRQSRRFRCSAGSPEGSGAPPLLKVAVGGVTELLRLFSPKDSREDAVGIREEVSLPRSVDDVLGFLAADYERAYFLTGRARYAQNLDLLVPFFDDPSLELEKIEKGCNNELNFILATWKLRTYLKLPWRPFIAIGGKTTYDLDKDFKIVRHAESWNVSSLEAISQIFKVASREIDS